MKDNKYFNFRIFITLDHRKDIKRTEKEIAAAKKELKYWNDFKTKGSQDLDFQISLLKKELFYMRDNYEIITGNKLGDEFSSQYI